MLLSYQETTGLQYESFCCRLFLVYLGVCETLHRRSQSRCHLSQFHTVCPLLSQSSVFLLVSDDFSFRTRMGPQVTSSTPIRIPRCPQMAPRGPFWITLGSLGITFCPLGLLLGASWAPLGPLGRLLGRGMKFHIFCIHAPLRNLMALS